MSKCAICGREIKERIDLSTGKPYKLQMCVNDDCIFEAWKVVTGALKKGVRPDFSKIRKTKRQYVKLTPEQKKRIIELYMQGMRQCDIAREVNVSTEKVCYIVKKYREGKKH